MSGPSKVVRAGVHCTCNLFDSFRFRCGRNFSSLSKTFSFGSLASIFVSGDLRPATGDRERHLAAAAAAAAAAAVAVSQLAGSICVSGDLTLEATRWGEEAAATEAA